MTAIKVIQARFPRFHVLALCSALAATLGLAAWMTSTDARIISLDQKALAGHDNQLASISARAERMQAFAQHIRKVSYSDSPDIQLPYGGYVGSADQVVPGNELKLARTAAGDRVLEVISVDGISPTVGLTPRAGRQIELKLVTGRILGGLQEGPLMRFIVAVSPSKPVRLTDHQSL